MSWVAVNFVPLMFALLVLLMFSGVPVAFALMACGVAAAAAGIGLGLFPASLLGALPLRVYGIVGSELLLAIPFFTFMGLVLQRSGMAEDLLQTAGEVFGPMPGGLALAVLLVGALLGATTGVVAASVISMGLISLPAMLRNGYDPRWASGVIVASGTLALVVPPSLVLIVVADQLGTSVGDMYAAALVPAALMIGLYAALILLIATLRRGSMPPVRTQAPDPGPGGGRSGHRSLLLLTVVSAAAGWAFVDRYPALLPAIGREFAPPRDELVMVGIGAGVLAAPVLAALDQALRLRWLSPLARRVAFVLVPPLLLIFFVLGTIYLGVATPTESGAIGAVGAAALAAARRKLTRENAWRVMLDTTKLSAMVMFILVGATTFSLSFQAADGSRWVEGLFAELPGGATGFMVAVTGLVFVLGMFLDFFEIAFVLLPLLAPVAAKLGIDLVWFGTLIGINLQASFMTPPFGYSLFFLRGVAPARAWRDPRGGAMLPPVPTTSIYGGVLPFLGVQMLVLALIIAFPSLILRDAPVKPLDADQVERTLREMAPSADNDRPDAAQRQQTPHDLSTPGR